MADPIAEYLRARELYNQGPRQGVGPMMTSQQYADVNAAERAQAKALPNQNTALQALVSKLGSQDQAGVAPRTTVADNGSGPPGSRTTSTTSPGLLPILGATVGGIGALGTLAAAYNKIWPGQGPLGSLYDKIFGNTSSGISNPEQFSRSFEEGLDQFTPTTTIVDPNTFASSFEEGLNQAPAIGFDPTSVLDWGIFDQGGKIGTRGVPLDPNHVEIAAEPDEFVVKPEPAKVYAQLLELINQNAPPDQVAALAAQLANQANKVPVPNG